MPRELPVLFWARAEKTRHRRGEPGEHLFASLGASHRAACHPAVKPVLRGRDRVLRRRPGHRACRHCLRAWRAGWGEPIQSKETRR